MIALSLVKWERDFFFAHTEQQKHLIDQVLYM